MRFEIEVSDLEELAVDLASWPTDDLIRLVQATDVYRCDWDLVLSLKEWVDREMTKHAKEIADDKKAAGECYQDLATDDVVHQNPHKGCILQ